MCGIFGLVVRQDAGLGRGFVKKTVTALAQYSESRGKDSSGLVFRDESAGELRVYKGPLSLNYLLRQPAVQREMAAVVSSGAASGATPGPSFAVIGHSRLVTNGTRQNDDNNQPVVKDGVVGIHNGIIVNDDELWSCHPDIERSYELDTEVLFALVRERLATGDSPAEAVSKAMAEVFGTVSTGFFVDDRPYLTLATNNGSLYTLTYGPGVFAFASERYFLEQTAETVGMDRGRVVIDQVAPGRGGVLDLASLQFDAFGMDAPAGIGPAGLAKGAEAGVPLRTSSHSVSDGKPRLELVLDPAMIAAHPRATSEAAHLEYNLERIRGLKRCSRCLLPETFPFIHYDDEGVCNYCNNYVLKNQPKPMDDLLAFVEPYRRPGAEMDCIVPFSGGRDSTFALHVVKNVLGLKPIAFTYDWGMVTDLARRNIARVCGKMGVENILVSADIAWKRENIRQNIVAWLRRPHLGMVPLFMAGDKFFFYYTSQVKKQTGLKLNVWGINPLENTDFKVGFMGVPPDHDKKEIFGLSMMRKAHLFKGATKALIGNPHYLNRTVIDTVGSFISRSVAPHRDFCQLYDYFVWDEAEIERLVLEEYEWEQAVDTKTTWRIGDGTAPFYNYIYYTVAGFSEFDTFRSNQIREGVLSRAEGMRLIEEENRPRYPSLKWYTEIVGLDFAATIDRINSIPKLYA